MLGAGPAHGRLYGLRGIAFDARIDQLLTRVDLLDASDRPLSGYSKGMLQRVGLAQALLYAIRTFRRRAL